MPRVGRHIPVTGKDDLEQGVDEVEFGTDKGTDIHEDLEGSGGLPAEVAVLSPTHFQYVCTLLQNVSQAAGHRHVEHFKNLIVFGNLNPALVLLLANDAKLRLIEEHFAMYHPERRYITQ